MRPPGMAGAQVSFPKPGKVLIWLLIVNVVAYVVELVLLRANVRFVEDLFLTPASVFEDGMVWQPFTYVWLHNPGAVSHLLWNMLWLYMFGAQLERWWGGKRFAIAYGIFALAGGVLTLIIALISLTEPFQPLLGGFWTKPHLGASGAIMGVTIAWGITFANETFNFLLLGPVKGKTIVWIAIAVELLTALSYDPVSSSSHFGGMIAAYVLCKGLWRPSGWKSWFRRHELERKRRKIEAELRVIQGGKDDTRPMPKKKGPTEWN